MRKNSFLWAFPLMDEATDGTEGAAGGNGGGEGHEGNNGGDGQDPAKQPLTLDVLGSALKALLPDLLKPIVSEQVNGLDAKWDKRFKKITVQDGSAGGDGNGGTKTKTDPFKEDREQELEARLAQMEADRKTERDQSLNRERDAEIRNALSEFPWKSAEDRQVAFDYYQSKAGRDEDGNLVITGTALDKFIKGHAAKQFKAYFQPRDINGSGNAGANSRGGSKGATLDMIKPNMTAEEDANVRNTLSELYAAAKQQ
jgi:hypothetical protein